MPDVAVKKESAIELANGASFRVLTSKADRVMLIRRPLSPATMVPPVNGTAPLLSLELP